MKTGDRDRTPELRLASPSFRRSGERLEVAFTAENAGDRPLYVQCGVRQVEWDAAARRLTVCFSDRGRRNETAHSTTPRTAILEAGEKKRIEAALPAKMTRLITLEGGAFDFEVLDLSRAESVRLVVGAAPTPFYFNPEGGGTLAQLKSWGADVEATGRVTGQPPGKPPGEEKPPGKGKGRGPGKAKSGPKPPGKQEGKGLGKGKGKGKSKGKGTSKGKGKS